MLPVSKDMAIGVPSWYRRLHRIPAKIWRETRDFTLRTIDLLFFDMRNRLSKQSVIDANSDIAVSLTTYGKRLRTVHLAIESIARGTERPARLVLWLDDPDILANPPAAILRLQKRGLEVLLTLSYGSHSKYYPYVSTQPLGLRLVTADDDQFYPSWWLRKLREAADLAPKTIHCHWAITVSLISGRLGPYSTWRRSASTAASFQSFGLGVAGIIYPVLFQRVLRDAGTAFQEVSPKADDVWLHAQAVRSSFRIRQIRPQPLRPLEIPGTQRTALFRENDKGGGNDLQISSVYTANDIEKIQAS